MRRGAQPLFFGALVAALAVSGCGSGSDTSAAPDGDQPSSAEQQEQGLRDVDPCQLLTPEEAAEFGFSGEGYDETLVDTNRKSTRLNSSHVKISYAVFCLKKKKYSPELVLF